MNTCDSRVCTSRYLSLSTGGNGDIVTSDLQNWASGPTLGIRHLFSRMVICIVDIFC